MCSELFTPGRDYALVSARLALDETQLQELRENMEPNSKHGDKKTSVTPRILFFMTTFLCAILQRFYLVYWRES